MLETIAIKTVFGQVSDFLKSVPREVWYGLALLAAWWFVSSHYYDEGRESVLAELRQAEQEAEKRAKTGEAVADAKAAERAEAEAKIIAEQIDAIEQAEATGENPLDAIF